MKKIFIKNNVRLNMLCKNPKYHLYKGHPGRAYLVNTPPCPIIIFASNNAIEAGTNWVSHEDYYTDEVGLFELIKSDKVEVKEYS